MTVKCRKAHWVNILAAAGILVAGCTSGGGIRAGVGHAGRLQKGVVPPAVVRASEAVRNSEGAAKRQAAADADSPNATASAPAASHEIGSIELASATAESREDDSAVRGSPDPAPPPTEGLPPVPETHRPQPAPITAIPTPIDFAAALEIAAGHNPQIGFAKQRIQEAFAQLESAEVLWVPSIRAGVNYNKHEGRIQDVAGRMIETTRGSVYTGFGAQAVGAGSPAVPGLVMNFHLRDAIFQPKIASRALGARQQAGRAETNDTLLETAVAYTDLLEALQLQAVAEETLANAVQLAELTKSFTETGQGLRADADRAQAELSLRHIETLRAAENSHVAAARVTRLLSADPTHALAPREPALVPVELVDANTELSELVATGLSYRPELAESQFLVGEAVQRLRRERYAPLVPSVLLGLSWGGNGGGLEDDIERFGDRVDFDAVAFWEVRNLGFGEQAARNEARSRLEQARWRQVQVMDQVAADVTEAHAQATARKEQIELAQTGIQAARDSYRRNTERIRDGQGLPIETLQSIQALDQAQRQYVRAVADYNRAQFRLHRALGWPVR